MNTGNTPNKIQDAPKMQVIFNDLTEAIKRLQGAEERICRRLNSFISEPQADRKSEEEKQRNDGAISDFRQRIKELESLATLFELSAGKLESII